MKVYVVKCCGFDYFCELSANEFGSRVQTTTNIKYSAKFKEKKTADFILSILKIIYNAKQQELETIEVEE